MRLLPRLYGIEECTYNSHAVRHFPSQVLDNVSLSFTSPFVFEAFIAHLKLLYSCRRGMPKQMVLKLGVSQNHTHHVTQTCKDTPSATRFASLRENQNVR